MDLARRVAERQARREDLTALVALIIFVGILVGCAVLPGFLSESASTVRGPAPHEVRR